MCWETLRVIRSFSRTFILKYCFYPVFVASIGSWGRRLPHRHDRLRLLASVARVWRCGPRAARAGRVNPLRSRTQVVRSPDRRGSALKHSWIFRIRSGLTSRSFNPYLFSFDPIAPGGGVHTGRHGDRRRGGAHTRASLRRLGRPPRSRRLAALIDRQGVCHWARLQVGHRCCPGASDVYLVPTQLDA